MSRRLRLLAALAAIGMGCGDAPPETVEPVKSAPKPERFADCMRENGVTEFPDPDTGDQQLVEALERLERNEPAWKDALAACKDLRPPGLLGAKASPEEKDARLEFARCMRENGVKDFPDPIDGQPLVDTNRIPSAAGRGARDIPGLHAAMDACRDAAADAMGER